MRNQIVNVYIRYVPPDPGLYFWNRRRVVLWDGKRMIFPYGDRPMSWDEADALEIGHKIVGQWWKRARQYERVHGRLEPSAT